MKHTRTVKWILCLCCLLVALWAFTLVANAEIVDSGNCGVVDETNGLDGSQVTWTLDDAGTLTVSGTGRMADYSGTEATPGAPWFAEKNSIVKVIVCSGVINVGDAAFSGCSNLQTVTLADSVTTVGSGAFSGCAGLKEIAIPGGVKTIGADAFSGCTGLTKVHTAGVAAWCGISFANSAANPLTQAHHLYLNGSEITDLVLPDGITDVKQHAFSGGEGLKTVSFSTKTKTIGTYSFSGCTGLAEIVLPNGLTSVGARAFYGCTALDDITLPTSVLSIGAEAFHNTAWYNAKVGGPVYLGKALYKYKGAMPEETEYDMKDGTLVIADEAFYNCANLRDINLPESLKAIGAKAFAGSGLEFIVIPSAVAAIGANAVDKSTDMYCDEGAYALTWANSNSRNCYTPTRTGKCGNKLIYKIYSDNTVIFSGSGVFPSYGYQDRLPWNEENVKKAVIRDGITSIGAWAFADCTNLERVNISKKVTSIGTAGFSGCTSLVSVKIPNSITFIGDSVFANCTNLAEISISDSVTSIGDGAFANCTNLAKITIPDSVTSIGDGAFLRCTNLANVKISGCLTNVKKSTFFGCTNLVDITIPNSVISIEEGAFAKCTSLVSVTISNSVMNIGVCAFYGCTNLTSITIPDSVECLGTYTTEEYEYWLPDEMLCFREGNVFNGCTSLTRVTIEKNVTSIGAHTFYGCTSLSSVMIPDSVTVIGESAFYGCTSLVTIENLANVKTIGAFAFHGCSSLTDFTIPNHVIDIGISAFQDCTGLTDFTIPDNVTSVGASAFKDCTNLESVTIGAGVKTINKLFDGCTKLKSITLPDTVTEVAASAFSGYSWLKEITLSKNLKEIKANTFKGCDGLKNITIPGSVKTVGANAFEDCTELRWARLEPGVETLKEKAFLNCSSLGVIYLPDSVTTIEADAIPEFTAIAGSVGSYAQQWAIANHRPFREVLTAANITLSPAAAVYNGKEQTTTVTVKNAAGTTLTEDTDYTLTVPESRTAPGEYVYVVEGIGNYADTAEAVFTVREALTDANLTLEPSTVVYNGKAQTTALTVKNAAGTVLTEGTDYTVVFPIGMTAPGDYPFTVIGNGLYAGTAKKTFTIQKHEPHTWNAGAVTTPATCTADGVKTFTCTYCGDTKTEPVKATGHSYGAWAKLDETQHQRVCANDKTHIEKADHAWDAGTVTKEATAEAEGERTFTCTVCGAVKTEPIPKTEPEKPELASGDVDGDGKITAADARLALRASVGLEEAGDVEKGSAGYLACDVDGDNKVTSADARLILRASVGLEDAAKFGKKA